MKTTKKREHRKHYARICRLADNKRDEVIEMFRQGKTCVEISRALDLHELTVNAVVETAIVNRELITDLTRYMPNPTFKPRDYSDTDEYTRHYAGAELEDTRNAIQRETEQAHPYRYRGIYGRPF